MTYLRFPDVHDRELCFVADNDIWIASVAGGRALRVTTDHARAANPRFSPSGRALAWTSWVDGNPDTYVLDRDSRRIARLTWWSDRMCRTVGWMDEDHVIVASSWESPSVLGAHLYAVSLDGAWEALPYGRAAGVAISPSGAVAIETPNYRDSAQWKRYRGGTASRIWLDAQGTGQWARVLPDEPAGCHSLGWINDRLLFVSDLGAGQATITDPHAQAQVYSVDTSGRDLRQHTHHAEADGYVRDPRTDGTTIVYHAHGQLYSMAGLDAVPQAIDLDLGVPERRPETLDPTQRLTAIMPDAHGDGSLVEWRGAAFFLTHRSGPARALSALPGVRVREPQVLGSTRHGVVVTDAEGEDSLEIFSLTGDGESTRVAQGLVGRVLNMAAAPDGLSVGVVSHDGRISVVTPQGDVRTIARSADAEVMSLAWSPDSRYLVWAEPRGQEGMDIGPTQLMCCDLTSDQEPWPLTSGEFLEQQPTFTMDGKYLVWISSRTFDPRYDDHAFDVGFSSSFRPWLAPLSTTQPSPFGLSADGWPLADDKDNPDDKAKGADPQDLSSENKVACHIDPGLEERIIAFPVPSGYYSGLRGVKGGVAWLRSTPETNVLGDIRAGVTCDEPSDTLEMFSFDARKTQVLAAKADSFEPSADGERLVVRHKDDVWVIPATHHVDDDDSAYVSVSMNRLHHTIRPRDEWCQMLDETWRLMRDHFWRKDMSGVDWDAVLTRYRPLVESLCTTEDLVDLLYEMVAELNTSHAYIQAPAAADATKRVGFLGIDTTVTSEGARIERILPSETSDPKAWSPLQAPGVDARVGDVITAVGGIPVADALVASLLEGTAGQPLELTLLRDGASRRVCVTPLPAERALRYHAWVRSRITYTQEHSQSRLGYVHIPDMMGSGWAQFTRLIQRASRCDGIIVDVRDNAGGHVSELVIERIIRSVVGWSVARHYGSALTYPFQAARGPVVMLTNQFAGSDGDIVAAAAQAHGIPVVGERSWGGVIGIDSRFDLVDGTSITQPRYATWMRGYGWGLENHGVDPDVEVIQTPADWDCDVDLPLDRAIDIALRMLEEKPAETDPPLEPPLF